MLFHVVDPPGCQNNNREKCDFPITLIQLHSSPGKRDNYQIPWLHTSPLILFVDVGTLTQTVKQDFHIIAVNVSLKTTFVWNVRMWLSG